MINQDACPILEVLESIYNFRPIKICFNGIELYNDYDVKVWPNRGYVDEKEPPEVVVPCRLASALEKYDVCVTRFEVIMVHGHHSLVYMYGTKVAKSAFDKPSLKDSLDPIDEVVHNITMGILND